MILPKPGRAATSSLRAALFLALSVVLAAPTRALAQALPSASHQYEIALPLAKTIDGRIKPRIAALYDQLARDGRNLTLDGEKVFTGRDKFLPGKIAIGLAHLATDPALSDAQRAIYAAQFRTAAALTLNEPNESWGLYYYALALRKLQKAGLLEQSVDPSTLLTLRTKLDWRTFVDEPTLKLKHLPNNYYGVAFSIARLRALMGWEDDRAAARLLSRTIDNYRAYSGAFGFSDETDGEGRFDRYSVLLSAEIAQRFYETEGEPPPEVKDWLRKSVDVVLPRLNLAGEGFEYGRSIGAYGDTAIVEVLSVAAHAKLLTPEELTLAYGHVTRAASRFADFWTDAQTGSVNFWDHGRRTDAYRGKHRILGENLSVAHQFFYTSAIWRDLGLAATPPASDYAALLQALPSRRVTWFADGEYKRFLITLRDRGRVIGLPFVNGGPGQHANSPYLPIPYSPELIVGAPDFAFPQLTPQITLADGAVLAPLAFFERATVKERGSRTEVAVGQSTLDRLGANGPIPDDSVSVATRYVFEPGRIRRIDVFTPKGPLDVTALRVAFAGMDAPPALTGTSARFAAGSGVESFSVSGLDSCAVSAPSDPRMSTPTGAYRSVVECASGARTLTRPFSVSWTLTYRAR